MRLEVTRSVVAARIAGAAALVALVACGSGDDGEDPTQTGFGPDDRPVELNVPPDYDHATPTPLLVVLHGYSAFGRLQLAYSQLDDVPALVLAPDGTVDEEGNQFWNATDACCDFYGTGVDDVAYIGGLIDEVRAVYNVDPKRIYLWGHSNGAFMSYRMACERAGDIAAIIGLAGGSFADRGDCSPSEPVSVLHIHGDADKTVLYEGGNNCLGRDCIYPSAEQSVAHWADYDGCADTRAVDPTKIDLERNLTGAETVVERHEGCPEGIDVELWHMEGAEHIPVLAADAGDQFWSWLEAHPKP